MILCHPALLLGCVALAFASSCAESSDSGRIDSGTQSGGSPATGGGAASGGAGSPAGGAPGTPATGGSASGGGSAQGSGGSQSGSGAATGSGGAASVGGSSPGTGGAAGEQKEPGPVYLGVRFVGRVDGSEPTRPRFTWSGTGFLARFSGTGLRVKWSNEQPVMFQVVVDHEEPRSVTAAQGEATIALAEGLGAGEHTLLLHRETEGQYGTTAISEIQVLEGELLDPPELPNRLIEIVGDSITCGYGNLGADQSCPFSFDTESHFVSYGAVAARELDAELSTIAISGHGIIRNYDGGTSDLLPISYERTLTMDPTTSWDFVREPDVVVVNLGTNDFAKGDPGIAFEDEYFRFLADLRDRHPEAYLLVTLGPMLNGEDLNKARAYLQNALESMTSMGDDNVGFLEYAAQGTGELGCDWHPNTKKHASMATALTEELRTKLHW